MRMKKMTTYQLRISVSKPINVKVGALGVYSFPRGSYIYTGSAKKNIDSRIAKHQSKNKKLRWHIDYLLNSSEVMIIKVSKTNRNECYWNKTVDGEIVVDKFGASDCRKGCGSHLKYLGAGF
jgi:Uri superfamily endonuclease